MLVHPGNHIGDTWYYVQDKFVHCYYLTCPDNIERHTAWDVCHATSQDLVSWEIQGIVLRRGITNEWDRNCLATGTIIRFENKYWMAYTARWNEPEVAIGLAVSEDLYIWNKCNYNPITKPDERFYEIKGSGHRNLTNWRDPFLFGHDGYIYHYVCASSNTGLHDRRGTLGVARTRSMKKWEVLPPPVVDPVVQELECPHLYFTNDKCFLIFSSFPFLFSDDVQAKYGDKLRHSSYYMIGDTIFGPFRMMSMEPIIPSSYPIQPYACRVICFKQDHYIIGTVWDDKADYICDPIPLQVTNSTIRVIV